MRIVILKKMFTQIHTKVVWVVILMVGWAFPVCAQYHVALPEVRLHSVSDAIDFALDHSTDLDIYDLKVQKARKEVSISKSSRRANISGNFTGQYNRDLPTSVLPGEIFGQPGQTIEAQFGQKYNFNAGISISRSIFDWQSHLRTRIAETEVTVTEAETGLFRQNLSEQVALYYYSAIITKKALQISEKDRSIADSLFILTRQKFEKGVIDRSSLNQAKINVNNIRQSITESTTMHEQAISQLKILLGLDADSNIIFKDQVASVPKALPVASLQEPDKEIDLLQQQVDQSELNVRLQKAAYLPKLMLNSYWGQQQYRNDFGLSFDGSDWNPQSYIGLSLWVPIFNGLVKTHQLKVAQIEQSIAQRNLQQVQVHTDIQDHLLLNNYRNSQLRVAAAHENLRLWDQNRTLAMQKYEKGLIALGDYFRTFEDYLKAENNYLNTLSIMYSYYATIISRQ